MFDKILISNRGEIACRVARTARRMGVRTVAVYSDADENALHVSQCDEAYRLGAAPPRESYLNIDAILAVARASGAQAIHPGYGFLSENEDFAAAVAAAGLIFIGPPPAAIRSMGSKAEAKALMAKARVPIVPGYHGADQDSATLAREAAAIGYPILIKPSAGGGGKGMRVVERAADLANALSGARREAKASFGDDRVLLEKYLTRPRHIELQIFADTHGNVVHLFERDCSVQRRHQKIVEEAPAPGMTQARRARMGSAAVAAARAIGYVGAGTVEFIVPADSPDDGSFYFMEMNTRLQVEHPVTETITGLDLVEWQLRVAAGGRLPLTQDEIRLEGHAIEARVYAEDAERDFLPSIGRIVHLQLPVAADVRVDTGVRAGDEITRHYDPMIAKLIVRGEDRDAALRRLTAALADCHIVGVATNIAFLQRLATHDAFARGEIDTGLIAAHRAELLPPAGRPSERVLAIAALAELQRLRDRAAARALLSGDRWSPWDAIDAWWLNAHDYAIALEFCAAETTFSVLLRPQGRKTSITIGERTLEAEAERAGEELRVRLDGVSLAATVVTLGDERHVFCQGEIARLTLADPLEHPADEVSQGGHLMAPMSGTVVAVLVETGQAVARGAPLMILEAMKMEHTIAAPAAGRVTAINYRPGEQVAEGADLIDIDSATGG